MSLKDLGDGQSESWHFVKPHISCRHDSASGRIRRTAGHCDREHTAMAKRLVTDS